MQPALFHDPLWAERPQNNPASPVQVRVTKAYGKDKYEMW